LPHATAKDYDGIVVEKASEPFDIVRHPYWPYLDARADRSISFPGGLIKRVVEAFATQLRPDGIFVICDTAEFSLDSPDGAPLERGKSGVAAQYKVDDYCVAQLILEEEFGLHARLLDFRTLAKYYLPPDWQGKAANQDILDIVDSRSTTAVMVVGKRPWAEIAPGLEGKVD
jgi:hypothetical protein